MKIIVLFLFITLSIFSQEAKKEYFYDEEWKRVTREEFAQRDSHEVLISRIIENDTAIIGKLFMKYQSGVLAASEKKSLNQYIEKISGSAVDSANIIIINYYTGIEGRRSISTYADTDYKKYVKTLHKTPNISQFFMYNNDINLTAFHKRKWIHDIRKTIEKKFFPVPFLYGNFVIIHPNGSYTVRYGEHHVNEVYKTLNDVIKDNAN